MYCWKVFVVFGVQILCTKSSNVEGGRTHGVRLHAALISVLEPRWTNQLLLRARV